MTPYEEERDARIKSNALRMKELGVAEAASKVATNLDADEKEVKRRCRIQG